MSAALASATGRRRMANVDRPPDPQAVTVLEDYHAIPAGEQPSLQPGDQVAGHFVVAGALGRGATGEVVAVRDLALDREVAMKVLRGASGPTLARFMREARVTARLDHPNVPPVYSLDFLPDGGLIFTMRKLHGVSLGEALRRSGSGVEQHAIATVNACVGLALKVCDALAKAHDLGVIHRDVKPDNIMLGPHGEVALVDWGECRLLAEPDPGPAGSTVGTPAYMSPEQARGEPADERSDIYAFAACFWHVLTRRYPLWDDDPERFWERKRRGEIDALPPAAVTRVPPPLLAILRRALSPTAAERYPTVAMLALELERFQAGAAVEAYQEGPAERVLRWLRRHRGPLLAATAVLLVAGVGAGLLWRERQRQVGEWGAPILIEDFRDQSWRQRWLEAEPNSFTVSDGTLVSTAPQAAFLLLRQPLSSAVAIEYDGWFEPGSKPCDLSVVWHEAPGLLDNPRVLLREAARPRGFWLQAGAYANYFCALYRWPDGSRIDSSPLQLHAGRHRIRAELDGQRLRMWVDGQLAFDHEELLPISTGYLGLYAYYPGKAFTSIRVYQKRLPEVAPVTHAADVLLDLQHYAEAEEEYRKVATSHGGRRLAAEATYRQGFAAWIDGRRDAALGIWAALPPGTSADRVEAHRLDLLVERGELAAACRSLVELYRRSPAVRQQLRSQWLAWIRGKQGRIDPESADVLIATRQQAFPDHAGTANDCAILLNQLGRFAETCRLFPGEGVPAATALNRMGLPDETVKRFTRAPWIAHSALLRCGDFATLIADPEVSPSLRSTAAAWMGEAKSHVDDPAFERNYLLLYLDRAAEVLDAPTAPAAMRAYACFQLGRVDEATALTADHTGMLLAALAGTWDSSGISRASHPQLIAWTMADAAALGDQALLDRARTALGPTWPDFDRWLAWMVIEPVIAARGGDASLLRERLARLDDGVRRAEAGRPWYLASYALGRLDAAAMDAMPARHEVAMWLVVGDALRAELAGDTVAAAQAWTRYRALPIHRRYVDRPLPDPGLERLAQWLSSPASHAPNR
jgi:hypothetical protein